MTDKATLRRALRAARAQRIDELGSHGRAAAEQALVGRLMGRVGRADTVAAYLAVGAEPRLDGLFPHIAALALPHVGSLGEPMRFLRWSPAEPLIEGPFGLRQPPASSPEIAPSLILAPLVGFDRLGGRLGQGGGFYDRAFARFPQAQRFGIAWAVQECAHLPLDPWDMPLHAIATEDEWIEMP